MIYVVSKKCDRKSARSASMQVSALNAFTNSSEFSYLALANVSYLLGKQI